MSKKILIVFSVLVISSMLFAACTPKTETPEVEKPAEEVKPAEELAVGIVLPTKDEPRWIQDQTRFQSKLAELGYDVEILFSQGDPSQEKSNVEALITKGVKVIILCPHDSAAAAASAEAARAAGVKVISYDRLITDTDAVDYYVTFDSVAVGEAQAQYLVDHATGEGNPLYLYAGAATDNNAFLFFEGAWNVLQPKVADGTFYIVNSAQAVSLQDKAELTRDEMGQIIGQVTTNWDFDDAKSLAEANLTAAAAADKGDVFILAPNDGTARAIADAFAADTDISSYYVTGQDAEIASVQYIIDGKQSMTVLKDVRMLVDDAIALAAAVVEGKPVETTGEYDNGVIKVPAKQSEVITVDQNNVVSAIIDSGYWDASEFTGLDQLGAEKPAEEKPALDGTGFLVCQITDTGGIDDKSFNATAWKGIEDAQKDFGIDAKFLESQEVSDYEKNINAFLEEGCDLIVTVGFLIADATAAAADDNPGNKFSIVDFAYDPAIDNVVGQLFNTDEAAFLAGYAAAAVTKTGKVGTFGGLPIPTVTIFMKGFVEGVDYYNAAKGTDVVVLGYDLQDETKGLFSMDFDDQQKGRELAVSLMDEGADVIMPVAGPVGLGAAAAIQERGNAYLIGVDSDWVLTAPEYKDITLTSVMKMMDATTVEVIKSVIDGSFEGGNVIGTLENGGVDIAPFYDLADLISAETQAELDQIKADIIAGQIKLQ
jgi:putative multiple sugar transport system substrate-binding protein